MPILVSYSEIALKSRYVRTRLEKSLAQDIENLLKKHGYPNPKAWRLFGRIIVQGVPDEAVNTVSKVFGVANAMPCRVVEPGFEDVIEGVVEEAKSTLMEGQGFAVRPKVVGDHSYGSQDVAIEAGSRVLDALKSRDVHVNLTSPDVTIYVEVRDKQAYIYSKVLRGVMGLPYGTQGKAVALFSGGIDSPVAAWMLMKRGVSVLPLFMDQRPFVGENYIDRAIKAHKLLSSYVPRTRFTLYSAPMGEIMQRITETHEPKYICVMCKRSMYRVAQRFAEKKGAQAIITGESLGQVASQTLMNINVLSSAISLPVLRPLIGLDKVEIEDLARTIGSYMVTAISVDGCKAVPKGPSTQSRVEKLESLEAELGLVELCEAAADNIVVLDEG